ncbi:hypothetical protein RRG08_013592 [Elysia crispata]|uniref:Uncharacterized protein n=1 Tax=Elysia crispata TaxID=231223 RepID=A0AAE0Y237_9GAST|nr:hypothetical protein RRG08_013592 [Elysia crispata]
MTRFVKARSIEVRTRSGPLRGRHVPPSAVVIVQRSAVSSLRVSESHCRWVEVVTETGLMETRQTSYKTPNPCTPLATPSGRQAIKLPTPAQTSRLDRCPADPEDPRLASLTHGQRYSKQKN